MICENFDLTQKLSERLDRHLVLPLIDFLLKQKIHPQTDVLKSKALILLNDTNMLDSCAAEVLKQLPADVQQSMAKDLTVKREKSAAAGVKLKKQVSEALQILQNAELKQQMRQDRAQNLQLACSKFNFKPEYVNLLLEYAQFQLSSGKYTEASSLIESYLQLCSNDSSAILAASWGKLLADIRTENWESAHQDLNRVYDLIEQKSTMSPLQQLQQRSWLLHWSLFIFFRIPNGRDLMLDLFFQQPYLNAIQTTSPHMLRYLVAATILSFKKHRTQLRELCKIIEVESYQYQDPVLNFTRALLNECDFEEAGRRLKECDTLFKQDYFLINVHPDFMQSARTLLLETLCKVHHSFTLSYLQQQMGLPTLDDESKVMALLKSEGLENVKVVEGGLVKVQVMPVPADQILTQKVQALAAKTKTLLAGVQSTV